MQTLKEFLKTLPKSKRIRIGTELGSKYIYCGTVRDLVTAEVDEALRADLIRRTNVALAKITPRTDPRAKKTHRRTAEKNIDKLMALTPLAGREVLDTYPGQIEPDALVIIVSGVGDGIEYSPPQPPLSSVQIKDESAASEAVASIYKVPARNMAESLYRAMVADAQGNTATAKRHSEAAAGLAAVIRGIPLLDPEANEAVIREAHLQAKNEFKKWRKHHGKS